MKVLFSILTDAYDRADSIYARYNPQLGYPEFIHIDWSYGTVDEEFNVEIKGFNDSE